MAELTIAQRREAAKLTQAQLAARVGISVSQLWRIENNQSGTTKPVMAAIERELSAATSQEAA